MRNTSPAIIRHSLQVLAASAALLLGAQAIGQTATQTTAPAGGAATTPGASPAVTAQATPSAAPGAQSGAPGMHRHRERGGHHFKRMDADGDGSISRAEFDAAGQKATERRAKFFEMADTNKDGKLSKEELQAFRQAHRHSPRSDQPGAPAPKPQG